MRFSFCRFDFNFFLRISLSIHFWVLEVTTNNNNSLEKIPTRMNESSKNTHAPLLQKKRREMERVMEITARWRNGAIFSKQQTRELLQKCRCLREKHRRWTRTRRRSERRTCWQGDKKKKISCTREILVFRILIFVDKTRLVSMYEIGIRIIYVCIMVRV
jgi:hypothetical protein